MLSTRNIVFVALSLLATNTHSHEVLDKTAAAVASAEARSQAQAEKDAGKRHIVTLHRQRVPVKNDASGAVSYKSVYFGSIFIGAPVKQEFSVVFDTGSGHVIIPSRECKSHTCSIHRRYSAAASQIAKDVDYDGTLVLPGQPRDQITVAFGTGEITGEFVHDRFCLEGPKSGSDGVALAEDPNGDDDAGASCMEMRIVTATEMSEEPFQSFSFDGVLGLGIDSLALAPEFSFVNMLLKNDKMAQPVFGVFLADSDDESSEICFGGYTEDKMRSKIEWSPVALAHMGYWQVQILSLRVGDKQMDYCDDGGCRAVVDTGTSLLAVPKMFADELLEELSVVGDSPEHAEASKRPARERSCKNAPGPLLHFELEGGLTMTLTPGDYARQATVTPEAPAAAGEGDEGSDSTPEAAEEPTTTCQPTLMPIDLPAPLGPKLFIWGEPVLKKFYTLYDWEQKRIGFALARHLSDDEDEVASASGSFEITVESEDLENNVLREPLDDDQAFDEWLASPTGAAASKPLLR